MGDLSGDGKQYVLVLQDVLTANGSVSAQETLMAQTFLSNGQGGFQATKTTQIQTPIPNATNEFPRFD